MVENDMKNGLPPFGELLRDHRARAGLTQEQLAECLDVHHTTVHRWESGQRTPGVQQISTIVRSLGLDDAQRDRLLEAAGHVLPRAPRIPDEHGELAASFCPYRGLFAFREQDAPSFFGRQEFVDRLLERAQRSPLVAVIGPSGSGKSSVIYAGLVSQIRQMDQWLVADFRPGSNPFRALSSALLPLLEPRLGELSETLRLEEIYKLEGILKQGRASVQEIAERILQQWPGASRLLLVADQFEELYDPNLPTEDRNWFLHILLEAVEAQREDRASAFSLALALRADFLNHALAHRSFSDALQDSVLNLGPMTQEELAQAIVTPAEGLGVTFEPRLVERVLEDVRDAPGNLPLLEFSLTLLWERQTSGMLAHEAYEAFGEVSGALTAYAESVYSSMSEGEQDRLRRVFLQMVRPREGTENTLRLATRAEIGEGDWPLVQLLADKRLVVTNSDAEGRENTEIVHEALVGGWSRLGGWIDADRAFRAWQERLRDVMNQWEASGKDEGALLRGLLLSEAEGWLAQRDPDLSPGEREYVEASVELRESDRERELAQARALAEEQERRIEAQNLRIEEQLRSGRRQRYFIIALTVALVFAGLLISSEVAGII